MGYQSLKIQNLNFKDQKKSQFPIFKSKSFEILDFGFWICFGFWILNFGFTAALAQTAFDPLAIGLGARALGMGGAYVAVAENSDTIFSNPAGLGEIDTFQFTSMSGKLLEEVNYLLLGGVYPLGNQSALGIGYVGGFVSGIELRNYQGIFSRFANFGESVGLLSFGKKFGEKTSVGISLKYYLIDASETDEADGYGWNVDLGLLQKDLGWVSLGLVGQNLLPAGSLHYQNGETENLPLTFKLGAKIYFLGSSYRSFLFSPLELNLIAEGEWSFKKIKNYALHLGVEFSPLPFLTLRAGTDNYLFTYGTSLKVGGISFDYAYQPTAQYFSLTFKESGWPPPPVPDTFFAVAKKEEICYDDY